MGEKRRKYTKEFKIEAARLILEKGRLIAEAARELGVAQSLFTSLEK
jgi:transposase